MADELPLFEHWYKVLGDLLDRTAKFPKHARFTFTTRVDNLVLDVLEAVVEARFAGAGRKGAVLREADVKLAKLWILLRLCHARRYLGGRGYEHLMRGIDEAGRMVGGWRRQQAER